MSRIHVGLMLPWIEIGLKNYERKKTANIEQEAVEIDSIVIAFSWGDSFEWYYCIVA